MEGLAALEEIMSIMLVLWVGAATGDSMGGSVTTLGALGAACGGEGGLFIAVLDLLNILCSPNHFLRVDRVTAHQNLKMKMLASR